MCAKVAPKVVFRGFENWCKKNMKKRRREEFWDFWDLTPGSPKVNSPDQQPAGLKYTIDTPLMPPQAAARWRIEICQPHLEILGVDDLAGFVNYYVPLFHGIGSRCALAHLGLGPMLTHEWMWIWL